MTRSHMFGAICPAREIGAAIIMPADNTEAMDELYQAEISTRVQQAIVAASKAARDFPIGQPDHIISIGIRAGHASTLKGFWYRQGPLRSGSIAIVPAGNRSGCHD